LVEGKSHIVVEAEPLGAALTRAAEQGVRYAVSEGIPYFVCTDGNRWVIYDTHKPVKLEEKVIAQAEISSGGDVNYDAARQLLALWRPAMPEVKVAKPPVLSRKGGPPPTPSGLSLQELRKQVQYGDSPPTSIRFPDGKQEDLRTWKDLLVAVAKWALPRLQQRKKLPLDELIERSDQRIRRPQNIGDGWLVETNWFSSKDCIRKCHPHPP